ncbi:MAG: hypothetical protein IJE97_02110 [Thermoguttaceae bacterium]|nr:hypothetical protein [Thermoguttaceae bacterium]
MGGNIVDELKKNAEERKLFGVFFIGDGVRRESEADERGVRVTRRRKSAREIGDVSIPLDAF